MGEEIVRRAEGAVMDPLFRKMEDLVTAVWDFSGGLVVNLIFLPRNAPRLYEEMTKLRDVRDDLSMEAEHAARATQNVVTRQLSGWINRVNSLHSEVVEFQDSLERQSICITGICLGYDAAQLLGRVNTLMKERNGLTQLVVVPRRQGAVEEVPLETSSSSLVGGGETLRLIQGHILDPGVGIIGIYGMGGIGKTTLLGIINNEFLQGEEASRLFDKAIWVKVSRDIDIFVIQKTIGDRVGLSLSVDDSLGNPSRLLERRAQELCSRLSQMPFILLLDDVWQKLDLKEIGIPSVMNVKKINRKVLFTTRSEQVCNEMGANQRVKVNLLDGGSSMTLFKSKLVTEAVLDDDDIQQLANQVVAKCEGLPISLITAGKAMVDATTTDEWCRAKKLLDHRARELSGMGTLLDSLKFSFDMLKDDISRSCFLYCALFPEDYNIPERQIIDYWVCEGLLDPENSEDSHIDVTRDRGHARIKDLQRASLLQVGHERNEETVKLHDTVRAMALGITEQGTWKNATRIFVESWISSSKRLNSPNLTTLLLRFGAVGLVPVGLFEDTPALRVLDLTSATFKKFPFGMTSLIQLQYLSLAHTGITDVPEELGNLVNLRHLNLSWTGSLRWIPQEAISRLTSLQVLDMWYSAYVFDSEAGLPQQLILSDLENLARLCDLSLVARSWGSLSLIVHSDLLRDRVRRLTWSSDGGWPLGINLSDRIGELSSLRWLLLNDDPKNPMKGALGFRPDQLPNLETLVFENFTKVTSLKAWLSYSEPAFRPTPTDGRLFRKLRDLTISGCHGFVELTWVGRLPSLQKICVVGCDGVTEVLLPDGDGSSYFRKLRDMDLRELPALTRISTRPLLFPSLECLSVANCPCLKQLAFGPESATKIKEIAGKQDWWDELQWDYPDIKSKFLAYFIAKER